MINEFKYGQTWKIWPSPLSLSLYSTLNSFTSVTKKKITTNVTTRWPERWVSQTYQVEINDNTILDVFLVSEDQIEHLKRN